MNSFPAHVATDDRPVGAAVFVEHQKFTET